MSTIAEVEPVPERSLFERAPSHLSRLEPTMQPNSRTPLLAAALLTSAMLAQAQEAPAPSAPEAAPVVAPAERYVVIPQLGLFAIDGGAPELALEVVSLDVELGDEFATTHLAITLENSAAVDVELQLLLPIDEEARAVELLLDGSALATPLRAIEPEEHADLAWEIARSAGSALPLELAGQAALRSEPLMLAAGERAEFAVRWEQDLVLRGAHKEYRLPRSEVLVTPPAPWVVRAWVRASEAISTVYSPTHPLRFERRTEGMLELSLAEGRSPGPGSLLLCTLADGAEPVGSSWAYHDARVDGGGEADAGYFLALIGMPTASLQTLEERTPRELTLVLDTSGSMRDGKLTQACAAAAQLVEGLEGDERFNLVSFSKEAVALFEAPQLMDAANRALAHEYLDALVAEGGTNLHAGVLSALGAPRSEGMLPLVLVLTDGCPTEGVKDEREIVQSVESQNPYGRRVFALGVGDDVNAPLLDSLSASSLGRSAYAAPGEDVELALAAVFAELSDPIMLRPRLEALAADGSPDPDRLRHVAPAQLPDLYADDALVIAGQYAGSGPLRLRLAGEYLGEQREFELELELAPARSAEFVPRLWAQRTVGRLVDSVRRAGAGAQAGGGLVGGPELGGKVQQMLRLSAEYGVLTEYTGFLALQGTNLQDSAQLAQLLRSSLASRAQRMRVGRAAVDQARRLDQLRRSNSLSSRVASTSDALAAVQMAHVREVGGRTFYRRGATWLEGRLVGMGELAVHEVVQFGSDSHRSLYQHLAELGQSGALALDGNVTLVVGKRLLFVEGSRS